MLIRININNITNNNTYVFQRIIGRAYGGLALMQFIGFRLNKRTRTLTLENVNKRVLRTVSSLFDTIVQRSGMIILYDVTCV